MEGPRERELKLTLGRREDYEKLTDKDGPGVELSTVSQTNHYFDTEDLALVAAASMLRLRLRGDGRVVFTFKQGGEDPNRPGFFDVLEVESDVAPSLLDRALESGQVLVDADAAPSRALRERFGNPALSHIGTLRTERRRRRLGDFVLELDEVTYPDGGKAYELEVETDDPDAARSLLETELRRRGIEARPQGRTKLEEFLRRTGR